MRTSRRRVVRAMAVLAAVASVMTLVPSAPVSARPRAGTASIITLPTLPSGTQRFVGAAYQDLLGRPSEAGGRAYWAGQMTSGKLTRTGVTLAMARSSEWLRKVVGEQYRVALDRAPTATELSAGVSTLKGGTKVPDFAAGLLGGAEFHAAAGNTQAGFAILLYWRIVRREATAGEQASVASQLNSGKSRTVVARSVFLSLEANGLRVDGLYLTLLKRAPEAGGRAYWAQRLVTRDDVELAGQLAGSGEYDSNAQKRQLGGTLSKPATTHLAVAADVVAASVFGDGWKITFAAGKLPAGTTDVIVPPLPVLPDGWSGHVTATAAGAGGTTIVTTVPAPLDQVFSAADVSGTVDLYNGVSSPVDLEAADGPRGRAACELEKVKVGGGLRVSSQIDPTFKWSTFGEKRMGLVVKSQVELSVDAGITLPAQCEYRLKLKTPLPTIPVQIGPIRFTIKAVPVVRIAAELKVSMKLSSGFACSVGGVWVDGDVTDKTGCTSTSKGLGLEPAAIAGSVTLSAGIALEGAVYGRVGLEGFVGPAISLQVAPLATPWCHVELGVEAGISLFVDFFVGRATLDIASRVFGAIPLAACPAEPPDPPPLAPPEDRSWTGVIRFDGQTRSQASNPAAFYQVQDWDWSTVITFGVPGEFTQPIRSETEDRSASATLCPGEPRTLALANRLRTGTSESGRQRYTLGWTGTKWMAPVTFDGGLPWSLGIDETWSSVDCFGQFSVQVFDPNGLPPGYFVASKELLQQILDPIDADTGTIDTSRTVDLAAWCATPEGTASTECQAYFLDTRAGTSTVTVRLTAEADADGDGIADDKDPEPYEPGELPPPG